MQVLLVRCERRTAGPGPSYDGQQQVEHRDDQDQTGSSNGSSVGSRLALDPEPPALIWSGPNWPVSVTALADSTRPISIDPWSPMNSRAWWKLCGGAGQAPAQATLSSAPVVASETRLMLASW